MRYEDVDRVEHDAERGVLEHAPALDELDLRLHVRVGEDVERDHRRLYLSRQLQAFFHDGLPQDVALYNEYHALLVHLGMSGSLRIVAPDNPLIGLMLPYSPLHHLLFTAIPDRPTTVPAALVVTSGNGVGNLSPALDPIGNQTVYETRALTIPLSSSDTAEGTVPASVQVDASNWNTGVTVTVTSRWVARPPSWARQRST